MELSTDAGCFLLYSIAYKNYGLLLVSTLLSCGSASSNITVRVSHCGTAGLSLVRINLSFYPFENVVSEKKSNQFKALRGTYGIYQLIKAHSYPSTRINNQAFWLESSLLGQPEKKEQHITEVSAGIKPKYRTQGTTSG